jgi:NAD-dependent dihydropyrimidine dehydrogenase PreA subunit
LKEFIMSHPLIDTEECISCGQCVEACPTDVLELGDDSAEVVNEEDCIACASCLEACPTGAITEIVED